MYCTISGPAGGIIVHFNPAQAPEVTSENVFLFLSS